MDLVPKEYKQKDSISKPASSGAILNNLKQAGGSFSLRSSITSGTVILVLLLALWGGFYFYGKSLTSKIENTKQSVSQVFSAEDQKTAENILSADANAALVQNIFKNHIYTSQLLDKVAQATLPQVQWKSYDLDVDGKIIGLQGVALTYNILGKQLLALTEAGFRNVEASSIQLEKLGGISFGVSFGFDPKIIQAKSQ